MESFQIINSENNSFTNFNPNEIDPLYINKKPENFFEDNEKDDNIINNLNNTLDLQNKKSHGSSIKTNATMSEIEQKEVENFSFFSFNNFQDKDNIIGKKELTKDSIDVLNNFIEKEKAVVSNKNITTVENIFPNNLFIKDIKNNLFNLDSKLDNYFKKPFMRKNIKKKENLFKIKYDLGEKIEDEKIKFSEKSIKDDDIKMNKYFDEEMDDNFDKKYNEIVNSKIDIK